MDQVVDASLKADNRLDVSVQAQILKLIRNLADERGVGILLVTHNMGVVAEIADRVTIMQNGAVVESGSTREVLTAPKAPYARTLIAAVPPIETRLERLPVPSEETQVSLDARATVRRKRRARVWVKEGWISAKWSAGHTSMKSTSGSPLSTMGIRFRARSDSPAALTPPETPRPG